MDSECLLADLWQVPGMRVTSGFPQPAASSPGLPSPISCGLVGIGVSIMSLQFEFASWPICQNSSRETTPSLQKQQVSSPFCKY